MAVSVNPPKYSFSMVESALSGSTSERLASCPRWMKMFTQPLSIMNISGVVS
nr:hypothetical protein [Haloferax sp. BAB-2207]